MAWVDYARGIAIILVVYRHTMVGLKRSAVDVPAFLYNIQEFLVNVRMPVFFVLSGIFLGKSLETKSNKTLIRNKTATLLYPYILWTLILISIQIFLSDYTNSKRTLNDYLYIITQPRELDHMWYLLALYNTSILLIIASSFLLKKPLLHISLAIALHFSYYFVRDFSLFSDLFYYYIFLVLGVYVSRSILVNDHKDKRFFLKLSLIIFPLFIAGQLFWFYNSRNHYEPEKLWYLFPFLLIILVACVALYCFCRLTYDFKVTKWLHVIGKSSLYIYILHVLVISSFRIFALKFLNIANVYFLTAASLCLGITIPTLIYFLGQKWKDINYLFSLKVDKA